MKMDMEKIRIYLTVYNRMMLVLIGIMCILNGIKHGHIIAGIVAFIICLFLSKLHIVHTYTFKVVVIDNETQKSNSFFIKAKSKQDAETYINTLIKPELTDMTVQVYESAKEENEKSNE